MTRTRQQSTVSALSTGLAHIPTFVSSAGMAVHLDLLPPFFSRGEGDEFVKAGHNLLLSVSPRDNSIGVFAGTVRKPHYA